MKKLKLFEENHKTKLETPSLSLDDWLNTFYNNPVSVHVEKVKSMKKTLMAQKKTFKISVKDRLWPNCQEAKRTETDILLLFKQLELRFPHAIVSPIPTDFKNVSLIEIYLEKIANNPFFRNDVAYCDFVDGLFKEYRMTKKKDRKLSEGTLRWLQCITEFPTVNSDDQFLEAVRSEFDSLEKHHKAILKSLANQADSLSKLEGATQQIAVAFEGILAMERASEKKVPVNVSGMPPEYLGNYVEDTINMTHKHRLAIKKAYGASTFRRVLVDPMSFELNLLSSWKKAIKTIQTRKRNYERAKDACDKDGDKASPALIEKKNERYIEYHKHRQGVLGFELDRYRNQRTIVFQKFYEDFAKFNLRGANEIFKEWKNSGVILDTEENEDFFKKNLDYDNSVGSRGSASFSVSATKKHQSVNNLNESMADAMEAPETTVSLLVTTSYTPKKRKHLKIVEGEILAAHKAENGFWSATNSKGQKGLVSSVHVAVRTKKEINTLSRQSKNPHASMPPGLNVNQMNAPLPPVDVGQSARLNRPPPAYANSPPSPGKGDSKSTVSGSEAEDNDNEAEEPELDDWSVSEDGEDPAPAPVANGKAQAGGKQDQTRDPNDLKMARISRPKLSMQNAVPIQRTSNGGRPSAGISAKAPPQRPPAPNGFALPPGINFNSPSPSVPVPTPGQMPSSIPSVFNAPSSMSDNNTGPAGFGMPGARPNLPSFGAPQQESAPAPNFGAPPSGRPSGAQATKGGGMFGFGGGARKTAVAPAASSSNGPPKVIEGMPPRPAGAMNFLADIKKGPAAVQLKKVPDAEKSKEIGGAKDTSHANVGNVTDVVGNGGGSGKGASGRPTNGGGGGMGVMGELQAKLRGRK